MIKWNSRSSTYQVCLVLAYIIFLGYAVGFSIPMWLGNNSVIIGLWMYGTGSNKEIDDVEGSFFDEGPIDEAWFDAVRALMLAGMVWYLLGVLVSLVENCCVSSAAKDYGVSGAFIFLAGLCGAVAVIVTVAKAEDDSNLKESYRWGFILTTCCSGLAILLSLILLISRNSGAPETSKSSRTEDYVRAHSKHVPYAPEYSNPGYRGDELPLVSGLPYQQPVVYGQSPYSLYRVNDDSKYDQGKYNPYGYRDSRPGNRSSMAEAGGADLSNGFSPNMIQNDQPMYGKSDYYYSKRPY